VVWCLGRADGSYRAGLHLETSDAGDSPWGGQRECHGEYAGEPAVDHYEVMMLSANADPETIHRVYRMLAQRYHPDNPDSGDEAQFKRLLASYRVLRDPERRASFDAQRLASRQQRRGIFAGPSEDGVAGSERHKRKMLLSLLYRQRVQDHDHPYLTIHDLEDVLGYPRDHLQVSLWFLKERGYLTRSDNGRYTITAEGFEYAEDEGLTEFSERKLLTAG
jgi:curved DNA-binding protein CbpA